MAQIKPPPINLGRFRHRIPVTPGKRGQGRGQAKVAANNGLEKTPQERHRAMTWMQRLKQVLDIDIETCEQCGA